MIVKTCLQPPGNFGDSAINSYLVEKITGKKPRLVSISGRVNEENYLISGSVLGSADKDSIVWGAGFLSKADGLSIKPRQIHAVRGKLTRQRLLEQGIECPKTYGDPALLMPRFYKPDITKTDATGLIPHYNDHKLAKKYFDDNYKVIDICSGVENVIKQALSCSFIYSSSLHGLIIADAYNIPSAWVKTDATIGGRFKFSDYFSSRQEVDLDKLWEACPFK